MSTTNGWVKWSKVQEFDSALNGPDGELASFINGLIDQNAELAGKLEHVDSLTELAEKKLIEASKEAERIKTEAEREATARAAGIVARAEGMAEETAQTEAHRIIAEARQRSEESAAELQKKAEDEALLIRKEAEQLLESSKQTAQGIARVSAVLCAKLKSAEKIKAASIEEDNKAPEQPEPDASVCSQPDILAEQPLEQPSRTKEERGQSENLAPYGDFVDLALLPPIALDQMLELYKHLNSNPGVEVIDLKGSLDKGLWIRFIVLADTPLLSVFAALSKVQKISYEVIEVGKVFSAHRKPRWIPAILLTAGKRLASRRGNSVCLDDGSSCINEA
jgi:F0F1-type ATP synthase membrane subunit b/b'